MANATDPIKMPDDYGVDVGKDIAALWHQYGWEVWITTVDLLRPEVHWPTLRFEVKP